MPFFWPMTFTKDFSRLQGASLLALPLLRKCKS
jgi:hypothetical protein